MFVTDPTARASYTRTHTRTHAHTHTHTQTQVALHVPGHKRGAGVLPAFAATLGTRPLRYDLTEIAGLDYLSTPTGPIARAQVGGRVGAWVLIDCTVGWTPVVVLRLEDYAYSFLLLLTPITDRNIGFPAETSVYSLLQSDTAPLGLTMLLRAQLRPPARLRLTDTAP
jgi:hypothetical protein